MRMRISPTDFININLIFIFIVAVVIQQSAPVYLSSLASGSHCSTTVCVLLVCHRNTAAAAAAAAAVCLETRLMSAERLTWKSTVAGS